MRMTTIALALLLGACAGKTPTTTEAATATPIVLIDSASLKQLPTPIPIEASEPAAPVSGPLPPAKMPIPPAPEPGTLGFLVIENWLDDEASISINDHSIGFVEKGTTFIISNLPAGTYAVQLEPENGEGSQRRIATRAEL